MSPGVVVVERMQEQTKLEELRKQIQEGENSAGLVPRQERESGLGVGKASSEGFKALSEDKTRGKRKASSEGFKALSEDKTLGKREEKRSNEFVRLMSPFEKAVGVVEGMLEGSDDSPIREGELRHVAEVLAVQIRKMGTKQRSSISGSIVLTSSNADRTLYESPQNKPAFMCVRERIRLRETETVVPIARGGSFDIKFNLKGGDDDLNEENDDDLNEETVGWVSDMSPSDEIIIQEVRRKSISMDVTYFVHDKAVIATVQVKLLRLNLPPSDLALDAGINFPLVGGRTPVGIFGSITAFSPDKSDFVLSPLFHRDGNDFTFIYEGALIPLSKPSFGVSFGDDIKVAVDLFCWPFLPIAAAIVHVVPQYHGTYVGVISGPLSDIQVSVTFPLDAPSFNGPN